MTRDKYTLAAIGAAVLVALLALTLGVQDAAAFLPGDASTLGAAGIAFAGMAKPQYRILRKIGTIQVTSNGQTTIDLPRDYDYETLFLRLSGSAQVTVLATSVRAEAPCQWVPRIEVIADGKNTIYNAPLWFGALGAYDRNALESGSRATTPPSGVAVATYAVEALASIDFMTPDGVHPKDSNFRPSGLSLFQLRATFGAPGDIFVGGTVAFSGTPTLEVFAQQLVEQPDAQGNYATPMALRKVSTQNQTITASNSALEIRLPAGNFVKSVLVRTDGLATAGEPSTGVLNNAILQNGVDVRFNLSGAQTRAKNNRDYGNVTSGYYVLDVTSKGQAPINLTDLWDVTNPAEPKLILDAVGGANVTAQAIITEYIMAG